MSIVTLLINTVLNPPSFNDWQAMNSIVDMIVTAIAVMFREISIFTLVATALFLIALLVSFIVQEVRSDSTLS